MPAQAIPVPVLPLPGKRLPPEQDGVVMLSQVTVTLNPRNKHKQMLEKSLTA